MTGRRPAKQTAIPAEPIEKRILLIRGQKVMLDADLAELYGVSTKVLNQAVKRNRDRFPADFVLRLTQGEKREVVTNCDHLQKLKFSPVPPNAFTEHGVVMLASILSSSRAIEVSVWVVRAFIRLRTVLSASIELARALAAIERRLDGHDEHIRSLCSALRRLMTPPEPTRAPMGFRPTGAT